MPPPAADPAYRLELQATMSSSAGIGRDLPHRVLSRAEMRAAGCELTEPEGGEHRRLVQTYARDTGAIFTVLSVPVYVHGERWGAAVIGWDPDTLTT